MASRPSKGFKAHVYENDYKEMQKLVQQYPTIETGGDLFGLWRNENTVVIQLFIGPGKDCKRTTTSFHQDINYLGKVGKVITEKEGLCNVGEWHSHHQIGMPKPSKNDNETVLSNMPGLGLDRFVLFIASIETKQKRSHDVKLENIKIRCFMYKEGLHLSQQPIEGEIVPIPGENPIQLSNKAGEIITNGAGAAPEMQKEKAGQDKKQKGSDKEKKADYEPERRREKRDENTSPNTRGGDQAKAATYGSSETKAPIHPSKTKAATYPSETKAAIHQPQPETQSTSSAVLGPINAKGYF